jgi:uncharacterized protein involved in exopolysaccharide biosynthesis
MNHHEDEINLLDYWRVVVKRKWLLGTIVVGAFVISLIVSFLLPKIYAATTSILPPQQEGSSSFGAGLAGKLPEGLINLAGGLGTMKSPADVWVGILKSQTIKEATIDRFNLMSILKSPTREDAITALGKKVKIVKSKEEIISITVEDRDPKMAADIANAYVEELDRINKGIVMTSGRRTRVFVEERLKGAKEELARAEDALKAFQEESKMVKLDDQSKAIIEAIGMVKGHLMAKQVELETLRSYATPANPQVAMLETQVEELEERLRELMEGKKKPDNPTPKDIFVPTARIPDLAVQYARLFRDAKVQEILYQLLTQQYEMARIQEAKDSPTVQVLDTAKVPEKKAKPNRRMIVVISTLMAAFFGIFLAFFLEYLEKARIRESEMPDKAPTGRIG